MNKTIVCSQHAIHLTGSTGRIINALCRLFMVVALTLWSGNLFAFQQTRDTLKKALNHIYKAGEDGYTCFRIPAIITTNKGTVLAFAEARRNSCGDAGDIDLVLKSSGDGGKTWSKLMVVWNDSSNTCGNPAPVVDRKTGHIILLATWNLGSDHEKDIIAGTSKDTRRVYTISSANNGKSWSTPREITSTVKAENWTWYATGPVSGIQVQKGKFKGRLVIPCDHIEAETKRYFSHVIYSDTHGKTWKLGGRTPQDKVNESTVAELGDGKLMLNMRNFGTARNRQVATSSDGGSTWSDLYEDENLVEPVCQGSLTRYTFPGKRQCLVFSNPASKEKRIGMTVKLSYDDGRSWPLQKLLYDGPSAYSNITMLPNGNLGCLYEAGAAKPYEGIVFEEISLDSFKKD